MLGPALYFINITLLELWQIFYVRCRFCMRFCILKLQITCILFKYIFSNQYFVFYFVTSDKQVFVICNKILFDVFVSLLGALPILGCSHICLEKDRRSPECGQTIAVNQKTVCVLYCHETLVVSYSSNWIKLFWPVWSFVKGGLQFSRTAATHLQNLL